MWHENVVNLIKNNSIKFSQNERRMRKFSYEYDINNHGVDDIRICTICLEDIGKNHKKTKENNILPHWGCQAIDLTVCWVVDFSCTEQKRHAVYEL